MYKALNVQDLRMYKAYECASLMHVQGLEYLYTRKRFSF